MSASRRSQRQRQKWLPRNAALAARRRRSRKAGGLYPIDVTIDRALRFHRYQRTAGPIHGLLRKGHGCRVDSGPLCFFGHLSADDVCDMISLPVLRPLRKLFRTRNSEPHFFHLRSCCGLYRTCACNASLRIQDRRRCAPSKRRRRGRLDE
jgi:hypothetical protein